MPGDRCGCCPRCRVAAALAAGSLLSVVTVGVHSPLAFQGTPDDARNLLIGYRRHDGDGHRAAAGPDGGGAAAVVHPVLAPAAAQLPARPAEPDRPQCLRRDLRLQRGRAVHGRRVRRQPHRQFPPARGERLDRAAVRQPRPAGVLRRPPRALHPGRCDHERGAAQHAHGDPRRAAARRRGRTRCPGRGHGDHIPPLRLRAGGALPRAAVARRQARGLPAAAAQGRRARGRRDHAGVDLARLAQAIRHQTRGCSRGSWRPGSGSGSSGPWSKTPRSASGSWSTRPARHCPRRSTIPTPRSRPSITCR